MTALVIFVVTVTCNRSGDYFVAPHAKRTLPPEIAFLLSTPNPGLFSTSTPQVGEEEDSANPLPIPALAPPTPLPTLENHVSPILYYAQAADTLPVVAIRFGVLPEEITSPEVLPGESLLTPGQLLIIPRRMVNTTSSQHILPDSELVYSPSATDFDIEAYVNQAGGKLSRHKDWLKSTGIITGAQVVKKVALENSINPRLLLALLEYEGGWVFGEAVDLAHEEYPLGNIDLRHKGLFRQLVWAVNQLSHGYYGWREGRITELIFVKDGYRSRLAPDLNAGSVALQYYFSLLNPTQGWLEAIDIEKGFPALYERMFGSPWERALSVEPLYPPGLIQPNLQLPFQLGRVWSFTGGPHPAWEDAGSWAALDFAPSSSEPGCVDSSAWATAAASGLVVRSGNGVVVLDLDGDGREQTGWVLLYLHIASDKIIPNGSWLDKGDALGHPSCEGGRSTGTHVHIARKFNGEWIAADGPIPFVLSGWRPHNGDVIYAGFLTRGDEKVVACTCSTRDTFIKLDDGE